MLALKIYKKEWRTECTLISIWWSYKKSGTSPVSLWTVKVGPFSSSHLALIQPQIIWKSNLKCLTLWLKKEIREEEHKVQEITDSATKFVCWREKICRRKDGCNFLDFLILLLFNWYLFTNLLPTKKSQL